MLIHEKFQTVPIHRIFPLLCIHLFSIIKKTGSYTCFSNVLGRLKDCELTFIILMLLLPYFFIIQLFFPCYFSPPRENWMFFFIVLYLLLLSSTKRQLTEYSQNTAQHNAHTTLFPILCQKILLLINVIDAKK